MIVIVIGKDCVGKTYFREYVEKQYKIVTYEASNYINEAKQKYNIDSTKLLLDMLGEDYAAKKIGELIEENEQLQDNIVISGFRTLPEISFIMNMFGNKSVQIVEVIAKNIFCYIRNIARNRSDRQISLVKFNERQREDAKLGIYDIREKYEITRMENNSTRKKFETYIDQYMQNLLRKNEAKRNKFRERIELKSKNYIEDSQVIAKSIYEDIVIER